MCTCHGINEQVEAHWPGMCRLCSEIQECRVQWQLRARARGGQRGLMKLPHMPYMQFIFEAVKQTGCAQGHIFTISALAERGMPADNRVCSASSSALPLAGVWCHKTHGTRRRLIARYADDAARHPVLQLCIMGATHKVPPSMYWGFFVAWRRLNHVSINRCQSQAVQQSWQTNIA